VRDSIGMKRQFSNTEEKQSNRREGYSFVNKEITLDPRKTRGIGTRGSIMSSLTKNVVVIEEKDESASGYGASVS
jgi:hypothetical protein